MKYLNRLAYNYRTNRSVVVMGVGRSVLWALRHS